MTKTIHIWISDCGDIELTDEVDIGAAQAWFKTQNSVRPDVQKMRDFIARALDERIIEICGEQSIERN